MFKLLANQNQLLIRGPLGLWTFPILNALVMIVQMLTQSQYVYKESKPKARTYNIVRDEHGRIISIEEIWVE